MKIITSSDNRIFKLAKSLAAKKYRDKYGLFIAEGPNLLKDLKRLCECEHETGGEWKIDSIIMREDYLENSRDFSQEDFNQASFSEGEWLFGVSVYLMPEKLFEQLSETENSQGILAIVEKPELDEDEFFEHVGEGGNIVLLDRLQDAGNIGTIIRTADAAGYKGVMAMKGCADIYSSKVVRAAAGSVFREPVLFVDTPKQATGLLQKHGKKSLATSFRTENWYYDVDMKKDIALIIGNEGNGICPEFENTADELIKIPMSGNIDSLNASVAAAILMYESKRP